jgi:hypothetical protein
VVAVESNRLSWTVRFVNKEGRKVASCVCAHSLAHANAWPRAGTEVACMHAIQFCYL